MIFLIQPIDGLFSGHGFGINTNIFETNVINLAVVIAVVVGVAGNALNQLLDERQQTVLDNMGAVQQKTDEMKQQRQRGKQAIGDAEARALDLRASGRQAAEKCRQESKRQMHLTEQRLTQLNKNAILSERDKIIARIACAILDLAAEIAKGHVTKMQDQFESDEAFCDWIGDRKMKLWASAPQRVRRLPQPV